MLVFSVVGVFGGEKREGKRKGDEYRGRERGKSGGGRGEKGGGGGKRGKKEKEGEKLTQNHPRRY